MSAEDGTDTAQKIANDVAGPDTCSVNRTYDPNHPHTGAVVNGEDEDIIFHHHPLHRSSHVQQHP